LNPTFSLPSHKVLSKHNIILVILYKSVWYELSSRFVHASLPLSSHSIILVCFVFIIKLIFIFFFLIIMLLLLVGFTIWFACFFFLYIASDQLLFHMRSTYDCVPHSFARHLLCQNKYAMALRHKSF
jgi:hypothetical protein